MRLAHSLTCNVLNVSNCRPSRSAKTIFFRRVIRFFFFVSRSFPAALMTRNVILRSWGGIGEEGHGRTGRRVGRWCPWCSRSTL